MVGEADPAEHQVPGAVGAPGVDVETLTDPDAGRRWLFDPVIHIRTLSVAVAVMASTAPVTACPVTTKPWLVAVSELAGTGYLQVNG
jgi:hypothetical protein